MTDYRLQTTGLRKIEDRKPRTTEEIDE